MHQWYCTYTSLGHEGSLKAVKYDICISVALAASIMISRTFDEDDERQSVSISVKEEQNRSTGNFLLPDSLHLWVIRPVVSISGVPKIHLQSEPLDPSWLLFNCGSAMYHAKCFVIRTMIIDQHHISSPLEVLSSPSTCKHWPQYRSQGLRLGVDLQMFSCCTEGGLSMIRNCRWCTHYQFGGRGYEFSFIPSDTGLLRRWIRRDWSSAFYQFKKSSLINRCF